MREKAVGQVFVIGWPPTPKLRPRVTVQGGRAHAYTPAPTRAAEDAIRMLLRSQGAKLFGAAVPLRVTTTFYVPRPRSRVRDGYPYQRPDLDQFVKLTLDAANGILWHDDSQVVTLRARKRFADDKGVDPCIGLEVSVEDGV